MTDLMPGPGYTWDHDDVMGVYTLTRRIWIGRDMSVLELHRRLQDFLDTVNGILWDQITLRLTDEMIEWFGDPYEILGPGRLHSGSIIDRRNNDVTMYPPANYHMAFDDDERP